MKILDPKIKDDLKAWAFCCSLGLGDIRESDIEE